jgi:hypothetical protein
MNQFKKESNLKFVLSLFIVTCNNLPQLLLSHTYTYTYMLKKKHNTIIFKTCFFLLFQVYKYKYNNEI